MQSNKLFPLVLALGMTAGSTAVYADVAGVGGSVDSSVGAATESVGSAAGGVTAQASGGLSGTDVPATAQAATGATTTTNVCADGEACADVDASTQADATMTPGETEVDSTVAGGADTTLAPMGNEASADALADGSATTMPLGTPGETAQADATADAETLVEVAAVAETDALIGARAYDANNEWVGEISAVIPADAEGNEERFVIDVGGFLGIGEKPVAVNAEDLRVAVDAEGGVEHVVISQTQAELEAMPEVEM